MKRDTRRLPDGQAWMPIEDRHLGWPAVISSRRADRLDSSWMVLGTQGFVVKNSKKHPYYPIYD